MKNRLALIAAGGALALLVPLAACSSGSSSSNATSTTASSGQQVTDAACPFTGTVGTSSGGKASIPTGVTGLVNTKQGCADNIQVKTSAGVGAWSIAYATGPVKDYSGNTIATEGAATLVLTLTNGVWSGTPAVPTTVSPGQLDYVKSINVAIGPGNVLMIVFGLSAKKPYQASDSPETPGYISIGIG